MKYLKKIGQNSRIAFEELKKVDHKRDFLLPIRSVRTPTCVHRIPEIKNVIATYQPTSVNDHPKSF